ncbi:MAG: hypothetical protein NDI61_09445, partial [Bdellovibrionaceae bacterium]|nr:hypothetical protein [Pseudobdellovibrionaceae bacterium]
MGLRSMSAWKRIALVAGAFWLLAPVLAVAQTSPQGLTLQGRILKANDQPLEEPSVTFTVQVRSPGVEDCLLFEETHDLNMTGTTGVFAIPVGAGTRSGTGFAGTSSLLDAFNNSGAAIGSLTCGSGTSYTAASGHQRKLKLIFNDGFGTQTVTQALDIHAVPYALYADTLQGKTPSNFVQTIPAADSQNRFNRVFNTDYSILDAILQGTSTLYMARDGSNFAPTASVNFGSQKIVGLADPTNPQDAATKAYVDANLGGKQNALGYTPVNKAGDSMTGALTLSGDPTAALHAATKNYVDASVVGKQNSLGFAPVNKAGDTMTGLLVLSADPSAALGAATKQYVDAGLSGKQSTLGFTPVNRAGDTMTGALNLPSNGVAVGTNQLVVSGGSVGIGTTSPQAQLDVAGTGALLIPRGTTAQQPGTPVNGMMRYNSTTNKFEAYENSAWVNMIGGGAGGITSLNGLSDATQTFAVPGTSGTAPAWTSAAGAHTLNIPLASGAGVTAGLLSKADYDAFAAKQAALGYTPVNKAGDTMTGLLVLSADPAANLGAATKQYVDSAVSTAGGAYIKKDGTVAYTADQSMGGFKITNVADPA